MAKRKSLAKFRSVVYCDVVIEIECLLAMHRFPSRLERLLHEKLELLKDPTHPSLETHPAHDKDDSWIAHLTKSYRVIFIREGRLIRVREVGPHYVVDSHRLRRVG